jgi:DNA topoisomerase-3
MTLLRGLGVEELTQAELTGGWEHKLSLIERGQLERGAFMREIAQMTQQIVKRAKEYDSDTIPGDYATLATPCPQCGHVVKENYRRFACSHCDFSISKIPGGRQFELDEVEELLINKTIGPLQGFRSKMGRPFAAILKLAQEDGHWKMEFDFGQNDEDDGEPVDFSGQESVGHCPKCNGSVYEHGLKYVCENAVAQPKTCDFTTGKIILQQEISREQLHKLLSEGKTDLLTGFKSARTGRNFKAFLVKQPDGKIGFEFEPRGEGKGKPGAKTAAKKAPTKTTTAAKKTPAAKAPAKTAAKTAAKKAPARKKAAEAEANEESTSET